MKWYRKAAEQGHPRAQGKLGFAFGLGNGVPKNDIHAYMWLSLAASSSSEEYAVARKLAIEGRVELEKKMTPQQIAEAQRRAREWKPTKGSEVDGRLQGP